jgi:hypothetical protein
MFLKFSKTLNKLFEMDWEEKEGKERVSKAINDESGGEVANIPLVTQSEPNLSIEPLAVGLEDEVARKRRKDSRHSGQW